MKRRLYTEVKFGNWTLGNDVLEMADSGVLRGASFGYVAEKKEFTVNQRKESKEAERSKARRNITAHQDPSQPTCRYCELNKAFDELELKATVSVEEQAILKSILGNDQSALQNWFTLSSYSM
jgi:hypothetical protein